MSRKKRNIQSAGANLLTSGETRDSVVARDTESYYTEWVQFVIILFCIVLGPLLCAATDNTGSLVRAQMDRSAGPAPVYMGFGNVGK